MVRNRLGVKLPAHPVKTGQARRLGNVDRHVETFPAWQGEDPADLPRECNEG
jgi:hypothetical protein